MAMAKKRTGKRAEAAVSTANPEELVSAKKILELSSKIEAAESPETDPGALSSAVSKREKIALLAYNYWVQRGCQGGSPEEDWFRAERELTVASFI
jgi:hypothetical protein